MLGWQELILIFALLLFVFGPEKLPGIARELGKAMREINKATSGIKKELNRISSDSLENVRSSSTGSSQPFLKAADARKIDKNLSDIAKKLNLSTEGKTNENIAEEIIERINKREKASNSTIVKR